jgi:transketolase
MKIQSRMKKMKRAIVTASARSEEGHVPSAFSILDILWVLYDKVLKITPKNVSEIERDRFILSKGHASLGLYAVLIEKGFVPETFWGEFGEFTSPLGGHPDRTKVIGVEASTGSLGHGMPMAIGVALGLKIKKSRNKVYTVIGDGECNEGTIWESALLAAHHKLDNLWCIVDYNHSGDRALTLGDMAAKFAAFGWHVIVTPGHDHDALLRAFRTRFPGRPVAVIAETTKGHGSPTMENNHAWHHKSPSADELKVILQELK